MAYIIKSKSFLYFYKTEIQNKLKEIDLILKEATDDLPNDKIANALGVSLNEIQAVLFSKNTKKITKENIAEIMLCLNSPICNAFKRAVEWGCPEQYSVQALSYIFNIDQKAVQNAFDFLDIKLANEKQLTVIFAQIFI